MKHLVAFPSLSSDSDKERTRLDSKEGFGLNLSQEGPADAKFAWQMSYSTKFFVNRENKDTL